MKIYAYTLLLLFSCSYWVLNGQSINTEFGKNRIQYHDDFNNWSQYETENFVVYWYGKGKKVAHATIQLSEFDHDEIEKIFEHTLSDKIEVVVYVDISDLKQSNVGIEDAFSSSAGTTKVQGNKILVYFDGDHQNLRKQIRRGIATIYINSILYGSNLQEIVQNALLLNLPEWFKDGIVAYGGNPWGTEIEDELRELWDYNNDYAKFSNLAKDHSRVAGHSMWNYIAHKYGSSAIANIIYLIRINRDLENSFQFITGGDFKQLQLEWSDYYSNNYEKEKNQFSSPESLNPIKLKNKKGVPISNYRISPDGNKLAYVVNDRSKARVVIKDLDTGEESIVFKTGHKNIFQETDFDYPLIAWHPNYPELSIIYEHKDIIKLKTLKLKSGSSEEQDIIENFHRIYSFDYWTPGEYIFTATTDGYSDIYTYKIKSRSLKRLSEDFYDDLDASTINYKGKKALVFRSNRTHTAWAKEKLDTILPIDNFDLFLMVGDSKNNSIIRLTDTPNFNETQPYANSDSTIVYLSSSSGINNSYELDLNTLKSRPLSNHKHNVIVHHATPGSDQHFYNFYYKGNYVTYIDTAYVALTNRVHKTAFAKANTTIDSDIIIPYLPQEEEPKKVITEAIKFQSEFPDVENLQPLDELDNQLAISPTVNKYYKDYFSDSYQEGRRIIKYNPMRASASRTKFRLHNFSTTMDNSVLFEGLESYTDNTNELNNTPTGFLFKGLMYEMLENYKIELGLRVPFRFNGYEYYALFDNNKHRLDKRFAIYAKNMNRAPDPLDLSLRTRENSIIGLYRLKYPFDVYRSVRLTTSLRLDKFQIKSTDINTLEQPVDFEKRVSVKLEYVYDNSYDVSLNIKNGTRYKFYAEAINQFEFTVKDNINLDGSTGVTGVLGVDARHYIPVLKRAVLALRFAGATSLGSQRIVYYLGGMEGMLFGDFDQSIPVPESEDFSFKTQAPHLRGFDTNIRNGNTFVLANAEFRFPIFQFLTAGRTKFAFLRNLQVTGFFDTGVAWYGLGPDGEDNPLNTIRVASPPNDPIVLVEARYFRQPLVYGYGVGMRSTILGYFVKFDYAWGVETGVVQEPKIHISLGRDF